MKPVLKIKKREFMEWMYCTCKEDMMALADDVVEALILEDGFTRHPDDVWHSTGYISKDKVTNPEVAKWNKDEEIEDPHQDYDVEWV